MVKVNEKYIRNLVRKAICEALDERGTNLQSLYHFTDIDGLVGILETQKFYLSGGQKSTRNGMNYMSFTRHKSAMEGFAKKMNCSVRIEVDGRALSNLKNGNTVPHEYYSPNRFYSEYKEMGINKSAKQRYIELGHLPGGIGEYQNQAEESFESYDKEIPIDGLIKRIDILDYSAEGFEEMSDFMFENREKMRKLKEIVMCPAFEKYKNVIYLYTSPRDYNMQTNNCMPLLNWVYSRQRRIAEEKETTTKR